MCLPPAPRWLFSADSRAHAPEPTRFGEPPRARLVRGRSPADRCSARAGRAAARLGSRRRLGGGARGRRPLSREVRPGGRQPGRFPRPGARAGRSALEGARQRCVRASEGRARLGRGDLAPLGFAPRCGALRARLRGARTRRARCARRPRNLRHPGAPRRPGPAHSGAGTGGARQAHRTSAGAPSGLARAAIAMRPSSDPRGQPFGRVRDALGRWGARSFERFGRQLE